MEKEADSLVKKVDIALNDGEYLEILETVQKKLRADGKNSMLLTQLGRIAFAMKEYSLSQAYFKQAIYYDNNCEEAAVGLLRLIGRTPVDFSEEDLFGRIAGLQSKDAFLARVEYYLRNNNIAYAVKEAGQAYDNYPLDEEVLNTYISVLIKNNIDDPKIVKLIDEGKRHSDSTALLETEILYLYKTDKWNECELLSKRIIRRYPNSEISQTALEIMNKIKFNREKKEMKNTETPADSGPSKAEVKVKVREPKMTSDEAESKLAALIGLDSVKQEIFKIKKKIEFDKARRETLGIDYKDQDTYHFVFSGNPGTGKTTVARLLADILHGAGVLEKGHLVEAERGDLVGEFQGHTAKKTKEVIDKALGGVLFIDEAYSLVNGDFDDFGHEAVDTLVKGVEDHRNELVVILAGYREEMQDLISSNVGLESRFTKYIDFPDYTEDELLDIARLMASEQHYKFSFDGELAFKEKISKKKVNKKFGNARTVRTLMSEAYTEKALNFDPNQTSLDYMTILTPDDFRIDLSKDSAHKAKEGMAKLDKLIGLKDVKYEIKSTVKMVDYLKAEREAGNSDNITVTNNLHMCFAGNPGTGKTTVARIYAEILAAIGVSRTGELIEVSRSDLVGRYQGETAIKTKEICEKSYGGVLFIDEAYDLIQGENDSFGREAVATLIKQMEDHRDRMIVIFAGYSREMEEFMESNSGIKSRISKTITFPDYSAEEMKTIFDDFVREKNIIMDVSAKEKANEVIDRMYREKDVKFGNAREIRNLFESVWKNMVNRVETEHLKGELRRTFKVEDFENI